MPEAKLTPDLIPESVTNLGLDNNAIANMMYVLQTGQKQDGTVLNDNETAALNQVISTWNEGEGQSFSDVAAQIYPRSYTEQGQAAMRTGANWYKSPGTRQPTVYEEAQPLNLDTAMKLARETADIGLGAAETGFMLGTGMLDLGKSAVDFGVELYKTRNLPITYDQWLVDAKQKAADAPNITYQPKTLSGEGLQTIMFSPLIRLDEFAAKQGEKVGELAGGVTTPKGEVPSNVEMARMKDLYDLTLAAEQSGVPLQESLVQEYDALKQKFEGAITKEGEYIEINYPAMFGNYGVRELINLIPDLATFGQGRFMRRKAQARQKERLWSIGIDPNDPVNKGILRDYEKTANRLTDNQQTRSQNMGLVQQALIDAQAARKRKTRALYDAADNAGDASIPTQFIAELNSEYYDLFNPSTSTFNLAGMPQLEAAFNQFRVLAEGTPAKTTTEPKTRLGRQVLSTEYTPAKPPAPETTMRQLSIFRRDLNQRISRSQDPSEQAALSIVKSHLDNSMDSWFERDLFSGDPQALAKWREADKYRRKYAIDFDEEVLIKKIVENDLTQSEVKRLLIGLSEMNMPAQAAKTIQALKRADPENWPTTQKILQNDIKFDLLQPLLEVADTGKMNFEGFLRNYNRVFGTRSDSQFLKELFPDGFDDVTALRDRILAIQRAGGQKPSAISGRLENDMIQTTSDPLIGSTGLSRSLSVVLFGNQLAKSALKVGFMTKLFNRLAGSGGSSNVQKRILEEMTGQPWSPVVPFTNMKELPQFRIGLESHRATAGNRINWGAGGGVTPEELQGFADMGNRFMQPPNAPNSYLFGGLIGIPVPSQEERDIAELNAMQERLREKEFFGVVDELMKTPLTYPNSGRPIRSRREKRREAIRLAAEQLGMERN